MLPFAPPLTAGTDAARLHITLRNGIAVLGRTCGDVVRGR